MSGPKLDAKGREQANRIYEECCENPEDFAYRYVALESELAAMTAERDALRKDAERYNWLAPKLLCIDPLYDRLTGESSLRSLQFDANKLRLCKDSVDAAIDAAMLKERKK